MSELAQVTLDEHPPDGGCSSSGLLASTVVVGPHSPPRWIYERAIYTAAPGAYGEPVIQSVEAMDMSGAPI
jgi:hypothetical protein